MRAYVEANFLVELALEQAEHQACASILEDAEAGRIEIAVPAFAVVEAYGTVERHIQSWREKIDAAGKALDHMGRTASLGAQASALRLALGEASVAVQQRGREYRERFMRASRVVAMDTSVLVEAQVLANDLGMRLPDAVVLASVLTDATPEHPSCFLNRDRKDFDRTKELLSKRGSKLISRFEDGLTYLRSGQP